MIAKLKDGRIVNLLSIGCNDKEEGCNTIKILNRENKTEFLYLCDIEVVYGSYHFPINKNTAEIVKLNTIKK